MTDAKRHQQLKFDLIAGTFFLSLITGLTILFDLDVLIQSSFYLDGHWIFEDNKILNIFYKYGSFPGILLVIGALVIVPLSYQSSGFYKLRRFAFFLMFCLAIGPGLIVNLVLKENWGRPRPREIELFGGDSQFWPILCRCGKKEGKSFPCGHCSMAFFLLTPFFYYRSRNKKVAQLFLFGGLFISGVMGLARISAGGHFFSDVLWSGGLIWLTAAIGAFIFKLNDKIDPKSFSVNQKLKKRMALFTYVLLPIVLIGVMVATPYSESKSFGLPEEAVELYEQITTEFIVGNLHLREGNNYSIDYRSDGFGFPTSRLMGETEDDPIILRCNSSTGTYEASDKIHLYVEHWAKVNSYSGIEFDENRLMSPDTMGRIYDNVFYNFYQNADDSFGNYGVLFVFDVTEPFENSE